MSGGRGGGGGTGVMVQIHGWEGCRMRGMKWGGGRYRGHGAKTEIQITKAMNIYTHIVL